MFVARNGRVSSEEVAVGQGFDCQKTRKKPHSTYPKPHFTYPKPRFTYPKPEVSALPRTGNTITVMQKQYYRSAEMKCPRCGNRIVCLYIIINRVTLLYTAYHFIIYSLSLYAIHSERLCRQLVAEHRAALATLARSSRLYGA